VALHAASVDLMLSSRPSRPPCNANEQKLITVRAYTENYTGWELLGGGVPSSCPQTLIFE